MHFTNKKIDRILRFWLCIVFIIAFTENVFCIGSELSSVPQIHAAAKKNIEEKHTPFEKNGRLSVKSGKLINASGRSVCLKGVSTHGLAWYPQYVNKKAFQTVRDQWGVQLIRLCVYTEEYGGYCSGGDKKALLKLIDKGVSYATDLGMYVVIDWHILSDGNPKTHQKESVAFFKNLSKKYKKHKNIFYEICNEPNGGITWKNDIKPYAKKIIKTIRKNDKKAIILVGTPNWSQDVDIVAKDPIKNQKNIMYTLHFYAATHKEPYRDKLKEALKKKLPVFVSEFSICDASGNGSLNKDEAKKWLSLLKKHKISYVAWSLSNKNESASLIRSDCDKTDGWSKKDLSESGKWFTKQ